MNNKPKESKIPAKLEENFLRAKSMGQIVQNVIAQLTAFLLAVEKQIPEVSSNPRLAVTLLKSQAVTDTLGSCATSMLIKASREILDLIPKEGTIGLEDVFDICESYLELCYDMLVKYDQALELFVGHMEKARIEQAKVRVLVNLLKPKTKI